MKSKKMPLTTKEKKIIVNIETVQLPTQFGVFQLNCYEDISDNKHHFSLSYGDLKNENQPMVRIHSHCFTGDVFGSLRCDCGEQLDRAMKKITDYGHGSIVYLNQEGRGIGIVNKLKAYKLQEQGFDTVEANEELGFKADLRDYTIATAILDHLGINTLKLITNNPKKYNALIDHGINVVERIPIEVQSCQYNDFYLKTKKNKLNHILNI